MCCCRWAVARSGCQGCRLRASSAPRPAAPPAYGAGPIPAPIRAPSQCCSEKEALLHAVQEIKYQLLLRAVLRALTDLLKVYAAPGRGCVPPPNPGQSERGRRCTLRARDARSRGPIPPPTPNCGASARRGPRASRLLRAPHATQPRGNASYLASPAAPYRAPRESHLRRQSRRPRRRPRPQRSLR